MDKPTPPKTELHKKLEHLTTQQRSNVLAMLKKAAPAHNAQIQQAKKPA